MAATGSGLYTAIKPILEEGCREFDIFSKKMGAKISTYIAENAELNGLYAGSSTHGPSPLVDATGELIPSPPVPELAEPLINFQGVVAWITETLNEKILWNIEALPPHTSTPQKITPTVALLSGFSDLSDLRTSYGFWSLMCDAIVGCIMSFIPTPASASASDGSSGKIAWSPTESLSEIKHDFVFSVSYKENETALISWLENHEVEIHEPSGTVDVLINKKSYVNTCSLWHELAQLTKDCTFYKKQDDGELILLTTGAAF